MKATWVPQALIIILMLVALNPANPYAYYRIMRVLCTAAFLYLSLHSFRASQKNWGWIFGVASFVYNPIYPLHLTRSIWTVINIITIIIAALSVIQNFSRHSK